MFHEYDRREYDLVVFVTSQAGPKKVRAIFSQNRPRDDSYTPWIKSKIPRAISRLQLSQTNKIYKFQT